ncbi:MAG: hypothetical protein AVDCRST_MAG05-755 [uncultured Rubrobacteraceae bacterium]|uniref:GmrSD restriction endonucleases C-terminal domain-containing protein n=1 Tax=uncultured Rubrobacteraceae bacterium TaxID=349277 RepID=A0A6J4RNP1_9ACTN|nr:MAG: hypothetical protein AVDCRST_MAG05-755 [uncultured Rubrobacteraceae bacterium]
MRGAARRVALLVAVIAVATLSVSCSERDVDALLNDVLDEIEGANTGRVPANAGKALKRLEVASPGSMAGYDREDFPHWSDAQEFGWDVSDSACDVREAALIRDGEDVVVGEGCDVEGGRWLDPYTERTYTDPLDIDIDHLVPLANAYRSGASGWDEAERERYANDPDNLLSVEDNANQEKGDKGPEAWKPPNRGIWCQYARRWIGVKSAYALTVNPQEKEALREMLTTCEKR